MRIAACVVAGLSSWAMACESFLVSKSGEIERGDKPALCLSPELRDDRHSLVVTDQHGEELTASEGCVDLKEPKGVFGVRVYEDVSDRKALEALLERNRAVAQLTPREAACVVRSKTADWAAGLGSPQACTVDVLRHSLTLVTSEAQQCKGKGPGLIARTKCQWLEAVKGLLVAAVDSSDDDGRVRAQSKCAEVSALFAVTTNPECTESTTRIEAEDQVKADDLNEALKVLRIKTEFTPSSEDAFRTVRFGESDVLVNPAFDADTYVAIYDFPHAIDAEVEWKTVKEDGGDNLKNVAGFAGFLIASYAKLAVAPLPYASSADKERAQSSESEAFLAAPKVDSLSPEQRLFFRFPPTTEKGTRFIGPIRPARHLRYVLSVKEKIPEGTKPPGITAAQTIEYLPRLDWLVTLTAGLSIDGFFSDRANNPLYTHGWRQEGPGGSTSTSYRRSSELVPGRVFSPFVGLLVSPPSWNFTVARPIFQVSVGVPLNGTRGISQLGLGLGVWFRFGVSLVLSAVGRLYDQPLDAGRDDTQVVVANTAGAPSAPPTREALAGGFGLSVGFDLGIVGQSFLSAVGPLFSKEAK